MLLRLKTATSKTLLRTYKKIDISDSLIKFFNSTGDHVSINFDKGIATSITCAEYSQKSTSPSVDKIGCVSADIEGYSVALNVTTFESLASLLGEKQTTALLKSKVKASQHTQLVKSNKPDNRKMDLKKLVKQRTEANKPDTQKELIKAALFKANHADTLLVKGFDMAEVTILKDTVSHLIIDYAGTPIEIDGVSEVLKMKEWLKANA